MKRITKIIAAIFIIFINNELVFGANPVTVSINIGDTIAGNSNALGLAVDSSNDHLFLTTLSYEGQDNLYEFDISGNVVNSTRVPYQTGSSGNLDSITLVGGNLFVSAVQWDGTNEIIHEIIEINKSGTQIFSSFNADNFSSGGGGLTFNQSTNQLYKTSFSNAELYTLSLTGDPISSQPFESVYDIAYDNLTGDIFGIKNNILTDFKKNSNNIYEVLYSYDLSSFGIYGLAIDINQANGLIYIQNLNESVVGLDRNELTPTTIPLPATIWLFISVLLGYFILSTKTVSLKLVEQSEPQRF